MLNFNVKCALSKEAIANLDLKPFGFKPFAHKFRFATIVSFALLENEMT